MLILDSTSRTACASLFTLDYDSLKEVPIIETVVKCKCLHARKGHLLIIRDALHTPSMCHDLLLPLIM